LDLDAIWVVGRVDPSMCSLDEGADSQ